MRQTLAGIQRDNLSGQGEKRHERDARIDAEDQANRKRSRTELDRLIEERELNKQLKEMEL